MSFREDDENPRQDISPNGCHAVHSALGWRHLCALSCNQRLKMRRVVLLTALALVACGGDSTGPPPSPSIVGTWKLQTIDGVKIPGDVGCCDRAYSGQFVIRSDGSFTRTYHGAHDIGYYGLIWAPVDVLDAGTWVQDSESVTFTYSASGFVVMGTHKGNTLTFDSAGGSSSVYVRG